MSAISRTAAAVAAALLAAVPGARAQPAPCNSTADCVVPLVCGRNVCRRMGCDTAADCRSPADRCVAGRCYDPAEEGWIWQVTQASRLEEKSPVAGVLLGLVFPGLGNFYAEDPMGLIPLAGYIGGAVLMSLAIVAWDEEGQPDDRLPAIIGGGVLMLASAVASPIWAYFSVEAYNEELLSGNLDAGDQRVMPGGVRVGLGLGTLAVTW